MKFKVTNFMELVCNGIPPTKIELHQLFLKKLMFLTSALILLNLLILSPITL